MYKIDSKYENLNRKIYIDSNFEHLLASNFTESLFLKSLNAYKILDDLLNVYFRQIFSKISEKSVIAQIKYFVNFKLSSASRFFCTESREIQFSISTR